MAQLVARFHGMEEVGGSNPPSSTEKTDTQLVSVGFYCSESLVVAFFSLACSLLRFSISSGSVGCWSMLACLSPSVCVLLPVCLDVAGCIA